MVYMQSAVRHTRRLIWGNIAYASGRVVELTIGSTSLLLIGNSTLAMVSEIFWRLSPSSAKLSQLDSALIASDMLNGRRRADR